MADCEADGPMVLEPTSQEIWVSSKMRIREVFRATMKGWRQSCRVVCLADLKLAKETNLEWM
jgi:hypothetical protein